MSAASPTIPYAAAESARARRITAAVLLGIAALFLFRLGGLGFFDPDEGRYAAIPSAMLRTGDFVVPYLQGFPYLEKPPLLYWMTAATLAVFGHGEFAARLPVAITGYLGVLAVMWIAWRARGPRVAWLSGVLVALTMQWFIQARFLTTDMVLAGLLACGLCAFWRGVSTGLRRWYLLLYLCVGLATLTKGFIGIVLPGGVCLLFILLSRRFRLLLEMQLWWGAVIVPAVVVPWFWAVQQRFPVFLHYFVVDQHLARYVSQNAEHERPFWFFVPVVVLGFFPWIVHLFFLRRRDIEAGTAAGSGVDPRARGFVLFLALWFLVIFGFFTASNGKLMSYVLPAFPPLAVLVALLFDRLFDGVEDARRRVRAASLLVAPVWIVLGPAALYGLPWLVRRDGRMNVEDVAVWPWLFGAVWGLGGLAVLVCALVRRVRAAVVVQAVVVVALFMTMIGAAKAVEPLMNPKPLGDALARVVKPADLVVIYRIPQPSIEYYIGRPPMLIAFTGEYAFGINQQPNPALFNPDEKELGRLLASDRQVYVVCDKDDTSLPASLPQPVEVLVQTTKRVVYRNVPGATGRTAVR